MGMLEETDQFQVLGEKVDALIAYTASLKQENERLVEKLHIEEEKTGKLMKMHSERITVINFLTFGRFPAACGRDLQ